MLDVLSEMEFNREAINRAYATVEALFNDLHMNEDTYKVIEDLFVQCSKDFEWCDPTVSMIDNMFYLASKVIRERYPNAKVSYHVSRISPSRSDIDVDNETYRIADEEFAKEFE